MRAPAVSDGGDGRPSNVRAAGDGEQERQAAEAAASETEAFLPAPTAAGGDAPREQAGPLTGARAKQATQSAEDGKDLAEGEARRQAAEAAATATFAQQPRTPAPETGEGVREGQAEQSADDDKAQRGRAPRGTRPRDEHASGSMQMPAPEQDTPRVAEGRRAP